MSRPNILYVFTDQQSHDAMSCTGNSNLSTPALDRLAADGTRFSNAYVANPVCSPSRAAMFTCRWPHQVGMMNNSGAIPDEMKPTCLGPVMSRAGYDCGYAGKVHVPGLFDAVDGHGFREVAPCGDNGLPSACDAFLREERDKPFFLVASFVNPHAICEYGRFHHTPFADVGEPPCLADCPNLPANYDIPAYEPEAIRMWQRRQQILEIHHNYTPEDWRRYRWGYNRLVEYVDAQIGQIMQSLEDAGHADDTIVVFSADHGDGQGAHRLGQKWTFYEESAKVPLIFRGPGIVASGLPEDALANAGLDLGPTICDLCDVDMPDEWPGESLKPLLTGEGEPPERKAVFCENELHGMGVQGRMVRTARFKYSVYAKFKNREQLVDLKEDPGEMVNLAVESRYSAVLTVHRNLLYDWCVSTNDWFGGQYEYPDKPIVLPGTTLEDAPSRS